ncbi:hypothetical protein ON010_g13366 [Phytophthora cinnamomi]|nr:hypothetical protein ON010_g13366 [Phytophthora cinnamomi]
MALARGYRRPRWLPLLVDVALAALFLLLDARDLWFKLRWVGPRDAFAFSTGETRALPTSDAAPLRPTTTFSYVDQRSQRASGWSSFLQQCEALTPVAEDGKSQGFRYAVGKNCMVGTGSTAVRAPELLLTSSIPVDSMAWTACELLYKHRKPPICHSPIVTRFRERFSFQNGVAVEPSAVEPNKIASRNAGLRDSYAIKPGSEAENTLIELLEVIGKSSPISAIVCVEGFILKGPGRYAATTYGCGSPSFYRSVFVGGDIPGFAQFQRDKGWLTSTTIRIMGMTFLIRENLRSVFTVQTTDAESGGARILEHTSSLNYSASGSLYIVMILVDVALLILNVCGVVEIARFMLWPLWKPLIASEYQTSAGRTTKMGFEIEDFTRVLQVGLMRSSLVSALTVISRLLSWTLVVPCVSLWSDGNFNSGGVHAFLTLIRCCDLVVLLVNLIWDVVVAYAEKHALAFVRGTYVTPLEITSIGTIVAICLGLFKSHGARWHYDRKRQVDRTSFDNTTAVANSFFAHRENEVTRTSIELYRPLLAIVGVSVFLVGIVVVSRFTIGRVIPSRSLVQSFGSSVSPVVQPCITKGSPIASLRSIHRDLTSNSAGILMRSTSPPPSPTRGEPIQSSTESTHPPEISSSRLPIEDTVDIPLRARSLIRSAWALEKLANNQLLVLPSSYPAHGIVLVGTYMKTRCGFTDVVQPLVLAHEHEQSVELESEIHAVIDFRPNLR